MISRHVWYSPLAACLIAALSTFFIPGARADDTWTYAVQISATTQSSPPRIWLRWPVDPYGASSYTVYRKDVNATSWGSGTTLSGLATGFEDANVPVGQSYEYQVVKKGNAGYTAYGYIYAGMEHPPIEQRGKVVLLVAADTGSLASELARLEEDLAGDGWEVLRHDVSQGASPAEVKNLVISDYNSAPGQLKAVFLFGHVPILMSGNIQYDSHGKRPLPADAYYGDIDGAWHPEWDPISRPSYMPSDIELMVGRVDFFDMPGQGAPSPWPGETELLRRYLNKDHAWRHKLTTAPRRAIMANRVGDAGGHAYAASGYRNFEPFVGPGNIVEANVSDSGPNSQRWSSMVASGTYLWSYGCGGGQANVISHLGTHGTYREVWSTDLVAQDAKAVFSMFFGSHFGEWTTTDNVMRAMLAAPGVTLTACLVGLPHWYFHHMAKGEPIGYAARLTMNNSTLYKSHTNLLTRCVLISLLGDPTLRMEAVAAPRNLSADGANGSVNLSWAASSEPVLGYNVYRSASRLGGYSRVNSNPVTGTSFTDSAPFSSQFRYYMVRAVALQTNPSGSYYNLSQGVFAPADAGGTVVVPPSGPVRTKIVMTTSGPQLTWNTDPGKAYHVQGMVLIYNNDWVDLSGRMVALGTEASFVDTGWNWYYTRYYRILAE